MGTVTKNFFKSVACFNFWKMQAIIKKRPSRNINVQNFWLYIFGMLFNLVAICVQDFDAVINKWVLMISSFHAIIFVTVHDIELLTIHFKWTIWCRGFFHGYSFITILMILNHALRYWQLDHVIIIFPCFPFGLSFVLPFSDPILDLFSVCFAVELLYQWWWSMRTILSRYVQFVFFSYMCWKECCSKVQQLVLRLIELL